MKITIIYDNTVFKKDLQADWGFSVLVEVENTPKILFDTGADGKILLNNMEKLKIDPLSIEEIFISHLHSDHTGGLDEFLKVNPIKASKTGAAEPQFNGVNPKIKKIYVPSSLGLKNEIILKQPQKIHNNVFSTGELENIEQSMGIETDKGIVLIVGCSHPEMSHILGVAKKFGKIYAVIGGMHGFSEFKLFKNLELICPTHCTQHKAELKKLYSQRYIEGGAGRIIKI
jgi:7,8-dihydropterin-6-yl-methyl-4-(beta-D-ribofuranosyl)aminobenzene 5'-phosphate synthase